MLPLGISFYTFQAISYVIDVHRGTLDKPASLLSFATYLTFFPQLVAGPIVRAKAFLPQLERREGELSSFAVRSNVLLLVQGMLKKMVLGDMVGAWLVDPVFAEPGATSGPFVLLALYGYSLQVYADFSGYTDMAQGMAGVKVERVPPTQKGAGLLLLCWCKLCRNSKQKGRICAVVFSSLASAVAVLLLY